ncbi:hypothetical protein [Mycobacterium helveticum]|jgi:hypothetical protein|nr:hypothetical protein [Mycobacterium helveticum]
MVPGAVIAGLDAMAHALAICVNDRSNACPGTDESGGKNLDSQMLDR